jgi:uncharacterized protein (TIGR02270 family)
MLLLALAGGSRELPLLVRALQQPDRRAAALWALGFTGRVEAVEACLPLLDEGSATIGRLAGEAISAITGLTIPEPPRMNTAEEDDEDEEDEQRADVDRERDRSTSTTAELPIPDPPAVRTWWSAHRAAFALEQRYIAGAPLSASSLRRALLEGPLRRADALSCALAIRSAGRVQLPAVRLELPLPDIQADVPLDEEPRWR